MSEAQGGSSVALPRQAVPVEVPSAASAGQVTPQEAHIMWLDRQQAYLSWAGLVSAFTLSIAFLLVSAYLIMRDHEISGAVLGTVDLVALVAVFITRQRDRD